MMRFALLVVALAACSTSSSPSSRGESRSAPPRARADDAPLDTTWLSEVEIPAHLQRPDEIRETEIARAVRNLDAAEFSTYSGAARRLVAIGEAAVPYLGHVGETRPAREGSELQSTIVLRAILRKIPQDVVAVYLKSPYRTVRIAAASVVGEGDMARHAAALVELLDDPDREVRRSAVLALRQLSNRFFGYRADAPAEEREEAAARWRELWGSG